MPTKDLFTRLFEAPPLSQGKEDSSKYCPIGENIIKTNGPTSDTFSYHVGRCKQCSKALTAEKPKKPL
jgi:hypothetical protein